MIVPVMLVIVVIVEAVVADVIFDHYCRFDTGHIKPNLDISDKVFLQMQHFVFGAYG